MGTGKIAQAKQAVQTSTYVIGVFLSVANRNTCVSGQVGEGPSTYMLLYVEFNSPTQPSMTGARCSGKNLQYF
jgi:hypothetical protein